MSRFRAMAARLCAAFIYVQLCLVACRDRLIRLLLLLPVILLPHTAMANTLFDMIKTVGDGAKGSSRKRSVFLRFQSVNPQRHRETGAVFTQ